MTTVKAGTVTLDVDAVWPRKGQSAGALLMRGHSWIVEPFTKKIRASGEARAEVNREGDVRQGFDREAHVDSNGA